MIWPIPFSLTTTNRISVDFSQELLRCFTSLLFNDTITLFQKNSVSYILVFQGKVIGHRIFTSLYTISSCVTSYLCLVKVSFKCLRFFLYVILYYIMCLCAKAQTKACQREQVIAQIYKFNNVFQLAVEHSKSKKKPINTIFFFVERCKKAEGLNL